VSDTTPELSARRPLRTRDVRFFQNLAAMLARRAVSPNAISASSIVFGCCAGLCFVLTRDATGIEQRVLWFLAATFIQFRLLANMLDGMVAVEGKRGGPTGELWNEAPDRVSDVATIVGAGYAFGGSPTLGWTAAAAALFVAYVRALGASAGTGQVFIGPMAKPQRMFWLTIVSAFFALMPASLQNPSGLLAELLMTLALIGGLVDFKSSFRGRSKVRLMLTVIVVAAVFLARDSIASHWALPTLPITLLALTVGGVFTSILRLREIASMLRTLKGAAAPGVAVKERIPEKP
jgi:phosphatidylglycerophosphate synthase